MTAENSQEAAPPASALTTLERATHFPTVLLVLAFLLAVDLATSLGYQSTALSLSLAFAQQHMSIGHVLLFFVAFGLYMSVGIGVTKYVADQIAFGTLQPLWHKAFPSKESYEPPYRGAVRLWKLREEAQLEQSKFYLDLHDKYENIRQRNEHHDRRLASSALACLLLAVANYLVLPQFGYPSVSGQLAANFPDAWEWISLLLCLVLLALWLAPILQDNPMEEWGYCLPLYNKLEDEKAKAREEGRLPRF